MLKLQFDCRLTKNNSFICSIDLDIGERSFVHPDSKKISRQHPDTNKMATDMTAKMNDKTDSIYNEKAKNAMKTMQT